MSASILAVLALSTAFTRDIPPQPPSILIPRGAGISLYEVDTHVRVCEFEGRDETCHDQRLDARYVAAARIMLYFYCPRFRWGYEPYNVHVRYERSPTGRYRAEITATRIRGPDKLSLRGWGDDPNTALRAAHASAFVTPFPESP